MNELEKIAYARSFINKLAEGINPLDDTPVPENDIVNNVRLSRCFFYVSDILRQVIDNGGITPAKTMKQGKQEFSLTEEAKAKFALSEQPVYVSDILDQLNALSDEASVKLPSTAVTGWLTEQGFLEVITKHDGKNAKRPTEQGRGIGIITEERSGMYGPYTVVLYTSEAQRFILDHLDAIIQYRKNEKEKRKAEKQSSDLSGFHNRPWTPEHDERLSYLFHLNKTITEMAYDLRRTEEGVRGRLAELGLIHP